LSHIHFLLLSSAFSYFFPNRPSHSFCFTFPQFAGCVSQLRTNNFRQYFILFANSHNSLPSSLTHSLNIHPILAKSIQALLAHSPPHTTWRKDLVRVVVV
jgi:hypothetical protein